MSEPDTVDELKTTVNEYVVYILKFLSERHLYTGVLTGRKEEGHTWFLNMIPVFLQEDMWHFSRRKPLEFIGHVDRTEYLRDTIIESVKTVHPNATDPKDIAFKLDDSCKWTLWLGNTDRLF